MKNSKVLIAGGGLGGLTAASCLLKAGFDVEVYEQSRVLKEVGAGVQLSANPMHVMRHLGLEQHIVDVGVRPKAYEFRLHDTGEIVHQFALAEEHERRHGAPFVQIHRADLQKILLEKARQLKPDVIHLGKEAVGFSERGNNVALTFSDGSYAQGDILIGADGIRSAISKQIIGGFRPVYTGNATWRLTVPAERLPKSILDRVVSIFVGEESHVVCYWVRAGRLMNFVGNIQSDEAHEESWTRKSSWIKLKEHFRGWHPALQTILDAADKGECYLWSLYYREPVRSWSTGRATLLGDAAHPTLPYMAQGAGMAMEDAVILTRSLTESSTPREALDLYQSNRVPRTTRIVERSNENSDFLRLRSKEDIKKHFANRDEGADRNSWLYSYNPLTVELQSPVSRVQELGSRIIAP